MEDTHESQAQSQSAVRARSRHTRRKPSKACSWSQLGSSVRLQMRERHSGFCATLTMQYGSLSPFLSAAVSSWPNSRWNSSTPTGPLASSSTYSFVAVHLVKSAMDWVIVTEPRLPLLPLLCRSATLTSSSTGSSPKREADRRREGSFDGSGLAGATFISGRAQ